MDDKISLVKAYEGEKELVVGIEHIDSVEECDLLFNCSQQYIKPTKRVLGKEIRITFEL